MRACPTSETLVRRSDMPHRLRCAWATLTAHEPQIPPRKSQLSPAAEATGFATPSHEFRHAQATTSAVPIAGGQSPDFRHRTCTRASVSNQIASLALRSVSTFRGARTSLRFGRDCMTRNPQPVELTRTSLGKLAPHHLRRTCVKLCRKASGEIEQIQLLLGHASVQTTERYLGRSRTCPSRLTTC